MKGIITLSGDEDLKTLLISETFKHPRASYTVSKKGDEIMVDIEAKDATALKTMISSVCRTINVYEKSLVE